MLRTRGPFFVPHHMQDLLVTVFPAFFSSDNRHAAMQFSIDALIRNGQIPHLALLLDSSSRIAAIEGDPGWVIERRKSLVNSTAYASWPDDAMYRVFLEPEAYGVSYPECYASERESQTCLSTLLTAYEMPPAVLVSSAVMKKP